VDAEPGMSTLPVISIVTPSYNQAQFLQQTMESVLHQDYPRVEYLVLDGGSTDNSPDIIRRYENSIAFWVSEKDNGQADAVRRGWQRATGDLVAWLNSDDIYMPGALTAVARAFQNNPQADVITGNCIVIDQSGRHLWDLPGSLHGFGLRNLGGNSLPQPGVFFRRSAVEVVGGINPDLCYVMDWELLLRLWVNGARFHHLSRVVAGFRVWSKSKTTSGSVGESLSGGLSFARERLSVLEKMMQATGVAGRRGTHQAIQSAWVGCLLEVALLYQAAGKPHQARECLARIPATVARPLRQFPRLDGLAMQLAYLDHADHIMQQFLDELSQARIRQGFPINPAEWKRKLKAETLVVQAWQARNRRDEPGAARHFVRAVFANPTLLVQRRVLSPLLKSACRAALLSWRGNRPANLSARIYK
jgi:hypothetical protein